MVSCSDTMGTRVDYSCMCDATMQLEQYGLTAYRTIGLHTRFLTIVQLVWNTTKQILTPFHAESPKSIDHVG